jgi:citrate synthase
MPDLDRWITGVTEIADSEIRYRGLVIQPLIDTGSLADTLWLLLFGSEPDAGQSDALRRSLIGALDHGVASPSALAARAIASTRSPIPFAIAGGLVAFAGPSHGGAAEEAAKLFAGIRDAVSGSLEERAAAAIAPILEAGGRVPGYGHPYHSCDPRVAPIMRGTAADHQHREIATICEDKLGQLAGRSLVMNADAAVAALLLDAGLGPADVTLITALGRAFGLAAHAREEQVTERPFRAPSLRTVEFVGSAGQAEGAE